MLTYLLLMFQPPQFELSMADYFDKHLKAYQGVTKGQIWTEVSKKYNALKGLDSVRDSQIVDFSSVLFASGWYYSISYDGGDKKEIKTWMKSKLEKMGKCAEREAIRSFVVYDPSESPRVFSKAAVKGSAIVAWSAALHWDTRCKSESDLQMQRAAIDSMQRLLPHKRNLTEAEASYQFSIYSVKNDLKALRKCVDLKYAAAKLDPRPGAMETTKDWCKSWEDYLKKQGY